MFGLDSTSIPALVRSKALDLFAIELRDADELLAGIGTEGDIREMDCIDCHNRPSHIYLQPDEALDRKLAEGDIPQKLPFIKQQALELITADYETTEGARQSITDGLNSWYKEKYPQLISNQPELLAKAIEGVVKAYSEFLH